jgi:hypothetical protein
VRLAGSVENRSSLNALGFSLPAGQRREPERRPTRRDRAPPPLSARTLSQRTRRSPTRKPSGKQGEKGNGPEDRSSGPLLTWCSRQVRDEREMARDLPLEPAPHGRTALPLRPHRVTASSGGRGAGALRVRRAAHRARRPRSTRMSRVRVAAPSPSRNVACIAIVGVSP